MDTIMRSKAQVAESNFNAIKRNLTGGVRQLLEESYTCQNAHRGVEQADIWLTLRDGVTIPITDFKDGILIVIGIKPIKVDAIYVASMTEEVILHFEGGNQLKIDLLPIDELFNLHQRLCEVCYHF